LASYETPVVSTWSVIPGKFAATVCAVRCQWLSGERAVTAAAPSVRPLPTASKAANETLPCFPSNA
jgi:hypothetical protein